MITKASIQDLPAIMDCYKATIGRMHELNIFQWDENYPTPDLIKNDIKSETFYILKENGNVLGCICLNQEEDPTYSTINWTFNQPVLVVHRLAINPNTQGKGVAKQFMKFAENLCVKQNYNGIRLDTFVENPLAIGLYLKLGYNQLGLVSFKNRTYYCFDKLVLNTHDK